MTTFLRNTAVPWCKNLLLNPSYASTLAALVVVGDFVLTQLIIRFIRCECQLLLLLAGAASSCQHTDTEIDWETYMYHIELYTNGERNYTSALQTSTDRRHVQIKPRTNLT